MIAWEPSSCFEFRLLCSGFLFGTLLKILSNIKTCASIVYLLCLTTQLVYRFHAKATLVNVRGRTRSVCVGVFYLAFTKRSGYLSGGRTYIDQLGIKFRVEARDQNTCKYIQMPNVKFCWSCPVTGRITPSFTKPSMILYTLLV